MKEKLLGLGVFVDNEYLDLYCSLIENNRRTKKEKFKTQQHHIIPRCYFKFKDEPCDNSKANLVNLSYTDHIIAHYYLSLCSIGRFHIGMVNTICMMLGQDTIPEDLTLIDLSLYLRLYEEFLMDVSRVHSGKIVSQESRAKMSKAKLGNEPWIKGKHHSEVTKAKLALSSSGNTNALGYRHNEERKRKMSENCTRCRPVRCVETTQVFRSASEVFKQLNIRHVTECCRNSNLTAGGYHWEYVN